MIKLFIVFVNYLLQKLKQRDEKITPTISLVIYIYIYIEKKAAGHPRTYFARIPECAIIVRHEQLCAKYLNDGTKVPILDLFHDRVFQAKKISRNQVGF